MECCLPLYVFLMKVIVCSYKIPQGRRLLSLQDWVCAGLWGDLFESLKTLVMNLALGHVGQ